ncbi:hypothetical protein J2X20_001272 [Pelomonas saccharophila]|uniref:Phage holin family protein n=1 Tax=Roseateles saccharophilus TaxID=304 RepID=A0ABU1YIJ9_ROSSA|nr:phage holin family protein [Roseateles saccharophilus]MDR7268643.1 hypothetical protein [Roseateles saccharophilus]
MADAPQDDKPLLAQLQSLWRELPGLVSDRVELLSLELQRAARALAQIVALMVAVAILGVTAWLVLWAGAIRLMVRAGLPWEAALLVAIGVNGLAILLAVRRVRRLLPRLALPLTQRHLMLAPDPQPQEAANDRAVA